MSKESSSASGGIGFCGLLTIALIVLKLMKYIDWSWWWVWSPIWIGALIVIAILLVVLLFVVFKAKKEHKQLVQRKSKWAMKLEEIQANKHIK